MRMAAVAVLGTVLLAAQAHAETLDGPAVVQMTLREHRFAPDTVVAPAGRPLRLEIINEDDAPEQVASHELGVAENLPPHGRASVPVGPLKPGRYDLRGEMHAGTAAGVLQVVAGP
jgi:hypothetical protein